MQLAAGAIGGLVFALLLLAANAGDLRALLATSPQFAAVFMFGAWFAFAPLVLCVAVGGVRRGQQYWRLRRSRDDHPLQKH